jgi:hypothetical protein
MAVALPIPLDAPVITTTGFLARIPLPLSNEHPAINTK